MAKVKTQAQIKLMLEAGKILAACHRELLKKIVPGVTTMEIDRFVEQFIRDHGATPEQKGFHGYPYATCACVNDVMCHGFPTDTPLRSGDCVTIDMVVNLNGWLADSAWSYTVGEVSQEVTDLLRVTKECLYIGIEQAVIGNRVGDISHAVEKHAQDNGYSIVREFTGHGIGQKMHETPHIPHYGPKGLGPLIRAGSVFTIEPILTTGKRHVFIDSDGWTARTVDGSLSAQYEHTIAVTTKGTLILTDQ
ncbi:type I methionyl aminopeptidase [Paenibacillus sp. N1-5-1-14]|uniref:type I methionyl aminopeptidase n=1 Tax=Paenibacillus radicibacter TaxID=2972488 RepID=UPI002158F06D|nr:type I methionyl aminopeptidase [Paenibacillus radicibacter]MCR8643853.1 type I methionyl aminopeptidase [Paenibacillus radicibacter]